MSLKGLFGAVYQDPQVLPVDSKVTADFIFIALFEKQGLDQPTVLVRKLPNDPADLLLHLVEREDITNPQSGIGNIKFVVGSDLTARGTIVFAYDVIAHGIDESSKALGMIDRAVPQNAEDTSERFLADIFDILARVETLPRLEANQFTEIGKEVLLSLEVTGAKPVYIGRIELLELHWHGCSLPLGTDPSELAFFPVYL